MTSRYVPRPRRQPPAPDPRAKLWAEVVASVARADNATRPGTMIEWADLALAEFDKRFPQARKP